MKPSTRQKLLSRLLFLLGILSVVAAFIWLLWPSEDPPFEAFIALLSGILELLGSLALSKRSSPATPVSEQPKPPASNTTIDGDGNVIGNDNTVQITEQHFYAPPPPDALPEPDPLLRSNLPLHYADIFVGRHHELTDVLAPWLAPERRVRAVAITGIGGIGKTSLAVVAATAHQQHFPGGIIFATARADPHFGLETLFVAIDETLGTQLRFQDPETRPALARARLNNARHLLILDNLETAPPAGIAAIVNFLGTLDVQNVGTLTLMTGRDMPAPFLDLAPRHHLPLDSLPTPDAIILLHRLAADMPGVPPQLDGHWGAAAAACHGHPLLLRLLVSLIQVESWPYVQRRLNDLTGDVGQRVDALLSASITRLGAEHPRAQHLLWSLGAFAGGATLEALACVHTGSTCPSPLCPAAAP